jgi:hypothetical protein
MAVTSTSCSWTTSREFKTNPLADCENDQRAPLAPSLRGHYPAGKIAGLFMTLKDLP